MMLYVARGVFGSVCLGTFLFMGLFSLCAQPERDADAYVLRDYKVILDNFSNVSSARDKAIEKASEEGVLVLLKKLSPSTPLSQLEHLQKRLERSKILSRSTIIKEDLGPPYSLTLDVYFNRDYLRPFLLEEGVSFAEAVHARFVVFPVLALSERTMLWEETNRWRQALGIYARDNTTLQFILPEGDVSEITRLSSDMALYGAADVMAEIASRYGAERVIVALARVAGGRDGKKFEITAHWYGPEVVEPVFLEVDYPPVQELDQVLMTAAQKLYPALEKRWQNTTMVELDKPGRLFVRFAANGAADLARLDALLSRVPSLKRHQLRVLNVRSCLYQLDYYGERDTFLSHLSEQGLLTRPADNMWWISLPEQAVLKEMKGF